MVVNPRVVIPCIVPWLDGDSLNHVLWLEQVYQNEPVRDGVSNQAFLHKEALLHMLAT